MAHLEWSDAFSIGVAVFDDEHKDLLVFANALDDAIAAGADAARLRKLEGDLFEHVAAHFRHEEEFFEDYPYAEEHAGRHANLLKRVAEYRAAPDRDAEDCARMLQMLSEALIRHIAEQDKKLGAHLCASGRAAR